MYSIYHIYMKKIYEYKLLICVDLSQLFQHTSVSCRSWLLLLWLFKAKREYSGVQRQCDMISTQGQRLMFIFSVISIIIRP